MKTIVSAIFATMFAGTSYATDLPRRTAPLAPIAPVALSQPFFVAEQFTGNPGKFVKIEETIAGFKAILAGEVDHLPEQAFYLVGNLDMVFEKAKKLSEGK